MKYIIDLIKGLLIGVANIIPGISGGTFALILGIYERLINAIGNLNGEFVKDVFSKRIFAALKRLDFWFLVRIFLGTLISVVLLSRVIEYFLEQQHDPTYAFFVGLIIPSIAVPWKMMQKRKAPELIWFLIGVVFLLSLSIGFGQLNDQKLELKAQAELLSNIDLHTAGQLLYALFSGALAISAMILPGISGSFVLLLLGQYKNMVHAINNRDFIFIAALGLGTIIGLIMFTRLLQMLLKKFHSQTIAFLIGLMVASLYTLWPFKKVIVQGGELYHTSVNILPEAGSNLWISLLSFVAGFVIVWLFMRVGNRES
jgi:putative membrane protein